jgi:hypothetical protein
MLVSRRVRITTVVTDGFERAVLRAPLPTLPVAPVMISFMVGFFFDVFGRFVVMVWWRVA